MKTIEPVRFLSYEEMERIHAAAKIILEKKGIKILSHKALDYLNTYGCKIDRAKMIAYFPEEIIEKSVKHLKKQYSVAKRLPEKMSVRYSQIKFTSEKFSVHPDFSLNTGGFCCFTTGIDGKKRNATLSDTRDALRLADSLPGITYTGIPCASQDIPVALRPIKMAAELVKHTKKYGGIEAFNLFDIEYITRIGEVVAGGKEALKNKPILVGYAEARSPLCIDKNMAEILIDYVKRGMPQSLDTMPCSGTTAPVTIAGTLALGAAETLAGLCLGYAVDKDATMTLDITPSFMDIKTMAFSYGSFFRQRWISSRIQLISEFYGCPTGVHGAKTDACYQGIQAGAEKSISILMPVISGAIGIGTAGHVENALTFSPAQLVIDAEISECIRKLLKGIEVTEETLALDTILSLEHGGNFLSQDHTLNHMMKEIDTSMLFDCVSWETFASSNYKIVEEKASEKAKELLATEKESSLSFDQEKEIDEIVKEAEMELKEKREL
ncbi:MAG: trimethylamine methyltransferase family protein [Candidatus Theseobacter exili]|nr:trimethylamine methyltransferase family protein [Candidatus Theseobacter exili]